MDSRCVSQQQQQQQQRAVRCEYTQQVSQLSQINRMMLAVHSDDKRVVNDGGRSV